MAGFTPLTGDIQMQGSQFFDPQALAQLQTDQMRLQQRQQLAQSLMQGGYVPNSGKAGVLTSVLSSLAGGLVQRQNNEKITDLLKRQLEASSQAAAAKHAQDQADEMEKFQRELQKIGYTEKAKKDYAPAQFQSGGTFDPSTGKWTGNADFVNQEVGMKGAEADAVARASAKYREAPGAAGSAKMAQIAALMKQPDSPTKTAQLAALVGEGGMQSMALGNMFGGGGGPTGDEFIKTLAPGMAGQVKAIIEGRQAPPTGMAMRSPMGQALAAAVQQADPTFDATSYAARAKTHNAFTAGNEAKSLNSINTAIGHAGTLLDAADALNNYGGILTPLNSVANSISSATGHPQVAKFNVARDALAGELTKAFRGSSGSEKDIQEAKSNLSSANSPEQMKAAIGQAMTLLSSKANSMNQQWSQAFGQKAMPNFLDPHAQEALAKLGKAGIDTGFDSGQDIGPAVEAAKSQGISEQPTQTATNPKTGQKIGLVNGQWVPI